MKRVPHSGTTRHLGALIAGLLLLAAPALGEGQKPGSEDDVSAARAREIARIREAYQLTDLYGETIWPGFDLRKIPILVNVDDREELLFGHPKPPGGFDVLEGYEIDGEMIHVRAPVTFTFVATAGDLGGVQACFVTPFRMSEPGTDFYLSTLVHEAFHAYQPSFRGYYGQGNSEEQYDPAYCALVGVESRILDAALRAERAEERDALLRRFAAVRRHRLAALEEIDVVREGENEFMEGTAMYAQVKLLRLLADAGGVKPVARTPDPGYRGFAEAEKLYAKYRGMLTKPQKDRFNNHHSIYMHGMSIGFLLDRVLPEWKVKLRLVDEKTIPPHPWGLLEELYPVSDEEREGLVAEARDRFGYDALYVQQKALLDARIEAMKSVLLAPGRRYRVDYSGLYGSANPVLHSEEPSHLVPDFLADEVAATLAERGFDPAAVRSYRHALVCEGGVRRLTATGVLYEGSDDPATRAGGAIVWIDRDPAPDGSDLSFSSDLLEEGIHHGLKLSTDGFTLRADRARLEVEDDLVTIELLAPEGARSRREPVKRIVRILSAEDGRPLAGREISAICLIKVTSSGAMCVGGSVTTDGRGLAEVSLPPGQAIFSGDWEGAPECDEELKWDEDLPDTVEVRIPTVSDQTEPFSNQTKTRRPSLSVETPTRIRMRSIRTQIPRPPRVRSIRTPVPTLPT